MKGFFLITKTIHYPQNKARVLCSCNTVNTKQKKHIELPLYELKFIFLNIGKVWHMFIFNLHIL